MIMALLVALQLAAAVDPVRNMERAAPAIRAQFDATLLDYPSARFREVRVTTNPVADAESGRKGPGYLCGFVNSKNRMGAYVGWQRFMATADDLIIEGDPMFDGVIDGACGRNAAHDPVDRSGWLTYRAG